MQIYYKIIFYIIKNLLMLHMCNDVLNIFFERKNNNISTKIKYVIYVIFGVCTHFFIVSPGLNIIITMVLLYIISTNFKCNIIKKIIFTLTYIIVTLITEIFISSIYVKIVGEELKFVVLDEVTNFILIIIYILILLIIVKLMKMYSKEKKVFELAVVDSFYICCIPICSIIILYVLLEISLNYSIETFKIITVCMIIGIMNIFFLFLFDKIRVYEKIKYENELLKKDMEYYLMIEKNANSTYQKISIIKHNLKYKLLYLKVKATNESENALEEIREVLDDMIEDVLVENQVIYTENKTLNSLLNYKIWSANKIGIKVDVEVYISDNKYIDEINVYTIIGNSIDNAIYNFDNSNSFMKNIMIRIDNDKSNLFIRISNPYNKPLSFKNGLPLTDKLKKELHGIGLKSIKKIVQEKGGYFKISTSNNVFTLEILLYDEIN